MRNKDNAIHSINNYPVDSAIGFRNVYPVDSAIQHLNNRGLVKSEVTRVSQRSQQRRTGYFHVTVFGYVITTDTIFD